MKTFFLAMFLTATVVPTAPCLAEEQNTNVAVKDALSIVANPNSSPVDFRKAMTELDTFDGEASFWLRIASDNGFAPDNRRLCVQHLLVHFVRDGMELGTLLRTLNASNNWVSINSIGKLTNVVAGKIPDGVQGIGIQSIFIVPILTEEGGDYRLLIWLSFDKPLNVEDLAEAFKSGPKGSPIERSKLVGFAPWSSDDQAKLSPGTKMHVPW